MGIELRLEPDLAAGQMVVAGFDGVELPSDAAKALAEGRLSGVILFERNLKDGEQVRELTASIRSAASVPPLIAVDQEGGRVQRLRGILPDYPSLAELGGKGAKTVKETAEKMGRELLELGINTNFAPVLDLDTNPDNPVIGDRAFGPDPERAARLGAAMIEGFKRAGIICCGKHFPGHGDTAQDSHKELPTLEADLATLERRELVPFQEAVKAGVPMLMTAHLKAPALDPYYPATISEKILQGLLRDQMGFEGVVITDDLEMAAISDHMPVEDAAFSAVKAGADLVLVCSGLSAAEKARAALAEAVKQKALDFSIMVQAVKRVLKLKDQYLLPLV